MKSQITAAICICLSMAAALLAQKRIDPKEQQRIDNQKAQENDSLQRYEQQQLIANEQRMRTLSAAITKRTEEAKLQEREWSVGKSILRGGLVITEGRGRNWVAWIVRRENESNDKWETVKVPSEKLSRTDQKLIYDLVGQAKLGKKVDDKKAERLLRETDFFFPKDTASIQPESNPKSDGASPIRIWTIKKGNEQFKGQFVGMGKATLKSGEKIQEVMILREGADRPIGVAPERLSEEDQLWVQTELKRQTEEKEKSRTQGEQNATEGTKRLPGDDVRAVKDEPESDDKVFDLKGDRLGMSLKDFKTKYARNVAGHDKSAPFCSDAQPGKAIVTLLAEPWHSEAGIVNCSIAFPFETIRGDGPTIAEVKTELLVHHFVDGKLYRITAWFPHDGYDKVKDGLIAKYGAPAHEKTEAFQNQLGAKFTGESLMWTNGASTIMLDERFANLKTSSFVLEHRELSAKAAARKPKPTAKDL